MYTSWRILGGRSDSTLSLVRLKMKGFTCSRGLPLHFIPKHNRVGTSAAPFMSPLVIPLSQGQDTKQARTSRLLNNYLEFMLNNH